MKDGDGNTFIAGVHSGVVEIEVKGDKDNFYCASAITTGAFDTFISPAIDELTSAYD